MEAEATAEEREAVDALLGPPPSQWEGGARGGAFDAHVAYGGHAARARRHLLLPALIALQERVGWLSEGGLNYLCERLTVPPADAWGVATFYALLATSPRPRRVLHVCDDIACRARGARELTAELERTVGPALAHAPESDHVVVDAAQACWMRSPCLGLCDHAPAGFLTEAGVHPRAQLVGGLDARQAQAIVRGATPVAPDAGTLSGARLPQRGPLERAGAPALQLLRRVGVTDPTSLAAYRAAGGYAALRRALELGREGVIAEVTASGLMGRGGAAFPTGRKWAAVASQPATPHWLVCNADESEPGTFKDRVLLEGDPFAIVESMTIAGWATGCERGILYLRGEYPLAAARMAHAIAKARAHGLLGEDVMGQDVRFEIEIRRGAGAYICGEETAIFNSIEGLRGEPRNKPPFPVQAGLWGKPTLVNNVETLANVLPIVLQGGAAFARTGTAQSTGTKLFCLSGAVRLPGVYEVPFGTTLRELLALAGGPPEGRTLRAVLVGGAAGSFVRGDELDFPLTIEGARAAGTALGSGVVMAFDDTHDLEDAVLRIAAFFRDESCGQCVPCRVGTVRQEEALHRLARGKARGGVETELALLDEVGIAMRDASICGLGQTAYAAVESAVKRLGLYAAAATT